MAKFAANGAVWNIPQKKTPEELNEELEYCEIELGLLQKSLAHWEEKDNPDAVAALHRDIQATESLIYEIEQRLDSMTKEA